MNGVERIAAERQRQIDKEKWTPAHDREHTQDELARAAACYALPSIHRYVSEEAVVPQFWPFEDEAWKPGDRIRELEKAGALIAAEIDRLAPTQEARS